MAVTLRQLRYFRALAEHGSFSRAAESVHVSQPALSLQIRELETALGGVLVERGSRGAVLTPFGRAVHHQALRVLDETLVLEAMAEHLEAVSMRITVGIVSTLAPYLLPGLVERLAASTPRVELNTVEDRGEPLVAALLAGHVDAAIVSLPLGWMELPERELFEDRFVLAARAGRIRAFGEAVRPVDLARADLGPLLTLADGHCLAHQVLGACSMWQLQGVHRSSASLATLARLVAGGGGLTLLPETAALCEMAASPGLQCLRFAQPEPARRIGLAHRAAALGQSWVDLLAEAAAQAGKDLTSRARKAIPT